MRENYFQFELCRASTLIVLAGGEGRRMGFAKSHLQLGGIPVLVRLLDRLNWPGPRLLVTATGREHPPGWRQFDAEVTDAVDGQGPLRAISTALTHLQTEDAIVLPVDMPYLERAHLAWMLGRFSLHAAAAAFMCAQEHQPEPLPLAVRCAAARPMIDALLASENLALRSLALDSRVIVEPQPLDWPQNIWTNLNFPADLRKAESNSAFA